MHASIQQTFIDSLYVPDSVQALGNQWWITQIWPLLQQTRWVSLEEIWTRYMCLQMFIPLSVEMVCLTQSWTSLPHTHSKLIKHQIFIRQSDNVGSIKKNKTWSLSSSTGSFQWVQNASISIISMSIGSLKLSLITWMGHPKASNQARLHTQQLL